MRPDSFEHVKDRGMVAKSSRRIETDKLHGGAPLPLSWPIGALRGRDAKSFDSRWWDRPQTQRLRQRRFRIDAVRHEFSEIDLLFDERAGVLQVQGTARSGGDIFGTAVIHPRVEDDHRPTWSENLLGVGVEIDIARRIRKMMRMRHEPGRASLRSEIIKQPKGIERKELIAHEGLGKISVEHELIARLPGERDDAVDQMKDCRLAYRTIEEGHGERMPYQLRKTEIVGDERSTDAPLATISQDRRVCLCTLLLPHGIKSLA